MAGILKRVVISLVSALPLTIAVAAFPQQVVIFFATLMALAIPVALIAVWFPRGRRTLAGIYYHFAAPATIFIFAKLVFWPFLVFITLVVFQKAEDARNLAWIEQYLVSLFLVAWPLVAFAKQQIWNNTLLAGWKWAQADWKRQTEFVEKTKHLPKDVIYREGGHHGMAIDDPNGRLEIIGRCLNVTGMDEDWIVHQIDFDDIAQYGAVVGGHGYDVAFVGGGVQGVVTGLMVGGHEAEVARMKNAIATGIDFILRDRTHWRVQMPEHLHPHWMRLLHNAIQA